MGERGLTKEQVFEAMDSLVASGKEPTISNIRETLRKGSLTTITKFAKLWKEKNQLGTKTNAQTNTENNLDTLENLNNIDLEHLFKFLEKEHPQIIAVAITYLKPENAAMLLRKLDKEVRSEVLNRISTLNPVQPNMLAVLNSVLEKEILSFQPYKGESKGGTDYVNNVLRCLEETKDTDLKTEFKKNSKQPSHRV